MRLSQMLSPPKQYDAYLMVYLEDPALIALVEIAVYYTEADLKDISSDFIFAFVNYVAREIINRDPALLSMVSDGVALEVKQRPF